MFLGYNRNSTYRVGIWRDDHRRLNSAATFKVIESCVIRPYEKITSSDIDHLKEEGTWVPFPAFSQLSDSVVDPVLDVAAGGSHEPPVSARQDKGLVGIPIDEDDKDLLCPECDPLPGEENKPAEA